MRPRVRPLLAPFGLLGEAALFALCLAVLLAVGLYCVLFVAASAAAPSRLPSTRR
jgi:hypothetical protein